MKKNNEIISLGSNPKFGHALVHLNDSDGGVSEGLILAAGNGGTISSLSKRGFFVIDHDEHGARVYLSSGGDGGYVELGIGEHGAEVKVIGEGGLETGGVVMRLDTHGGKMSVLGKGIVAGLANIGVNEHGGVVSIYGKGISAGLASIGVNEHGGVVSVYGKGSNTSRAVMGVNKYGNGGVITRDKNGYLQR